MPDNIAITIRWVERTVSDDVAIAIRWIKRTMPDNISVTVRWVKRTMRDNIAVTIGWIKRAMWCDQSDRLQTAIMNHADAERQNKYRQKRTHETLV